MRISEERQTELLNQIIEEDKGILWTWTKDGWGYPMITTNHNGELIDVCINYENEMAIVYIFDDFGHGTCKNMPVSMVNRFMDGEVEVISPMEMMFQVPESSIAKAKASNKAKNKKKMSQKSKRANRK